MKLVPLVLAAALVALLVWRWRRLSNERRAIGALIVAALAVYGSGVVHPPNLEHAIESVGSALGSWTYLLVGTLAFLETGAFVGFIAPGEFTILFGGLVAGQGKISVGVLIAIVWTAAVAGDSTSYLLGRRLGRAFLVRHGPRVKITEERLAQVEGFFERHGGPTILIGRFVGLLRALAPFVAGASRMPFRRFLPYDVLGAGIWAVTLVLLGYIFWRSFSQVVAWAKQGAFVLGTVIVVVVGTVVAIRFLRVPENRVRARVWLAEREREHPRIAQALRRTGRPLAAVALPLWRRVLAPLGHAAQRPLAFVWQRLTPGELGLEFTTALAVAAVGGFGFGLLAERIDHRPLQSFDQHVLSGMGDLRVPVAVDVAKVLADLGTALVVGVAIIATTAFVLVRRQALAAAALVVGSALTFLGVHIAKAAIGRPRPLGGLVDASGSSFPSGHAAYSVGWVAIAMVVVRVVPGLGRRVALVAIALVLAAAIGLTRPYLGVHYLSDVLGGWGLAAAIFALCATVAIVIDFLRHNGRR